jgi:hypothetical protein
MIGGMLKEKPKVKRSLLIQVDDDDLKLGATI